MNRKQLLFSCLIVLVLAYLFINQSNRKSFYEQVQSTISKNDSDYASLLHIDIESDKILAFYSTLKGELGVISLHDDHGKVKVKDFINRQPLITEDAVSWYGFETPLEDFHILYGVVLNPEVSQIILISQQDQSANIIHAGSHTIWYALLDERLNSPVTLKATNKDGEVLYQFGDLEYWENHKN